MFKISSGLRNRGLNPYYSIYYLTLDKVYNLSETQFPPCKMGLYINFMNLMNGLSKQIKKQDT